jgi:MFS family permease
MQGEEAPSVPFWKTLFFVLFEFGVTVSFAFVNAVLIPNQIIAIVGEAKKTLALGLILGISSVITLFVGPLSGYVSDKLFHRKRLPFVFVGSILWSLSIVIRSFMGITTESAALFWTIILSYTLITTIGKFFYTISQTPYVALIPDLYPKKQYGQASGMLSGFQLLGACMGVAVFGYIYPFINEKVLCAIVASLPVLTMLTLIIFWRQDGKPIATAPVVEEHDDDPLIQKNEQVEPINTEPSTRRNILKSCYAVMAAVCNPLKERNFLLLFISTFVSNLGTSAMSNFFLYYIRDLIHPHYQLIVWDHVVSTPEQAQAIFLLVNFSVATCVAGFCGFMGDVLRSRRKWLVMVGSISCLLGAGLMLSVLDFNSLIASGALWGIGTGSILTTTVSLVNENLPDETNSAKDLAVWSMYYL